MNVIWTQIIGKIDKIINSVGSVLDNTLTSKEEKGNIIKEIEQIKADVELAYQSALTERHKADMNSDSWLSKNVRPLTLIFLLFAFILFAILDGYGCIKLDKAYIELIKIWGELALMFYFGSRGIEKTANITKHLFRKRKDEF